MVDDAEPRRHARRSPGGTPTSCRSARSTTSPTSGTPALALATGDWVLRSTPTSGSHPSWPARSGPADAIPRAARRLPRADPQRDPGPAVPLLGHPARPPAPALPPRPRAVGRGWSTRRSRSTGRRPDASRARAPHDARRPRRSSARSTSTRRSRPATCTRPGGGSGPATWRSARSGRSSSSTSASRGSATASRG